MNQYLKKDICDLRDPGCETQSVNFTMMEQCITPELRYACRHWISHLHASAIAVRDDDNVHQFLKTHFLHWLEVMSLLRHTSEGVQAVITLESVDTVRVS